MSSHPELLSTDVPLDPESEELCWRIHDAIVAHKQQLAGHVYNAYMRGEQSPLSETGEANLARPFYDEAKRYITGATGFMTPLPAPSEPIFPWLPH